MILLAYMMVIHFVADFLLQSREMGKNKSIYFKVLLQHIGIQFAMFALLLSPFLGIKMAIIFALYNSAVHGVIDWYIWKGYKLFAGYKLLKDITKDYPEISEKDKNGLLAERAKNFKFWEDHWFFATIGLDQLLHTVTIINLAGLLL